MVRKNTRRAWTRTDVRTREENATFHQIFRQMAASCGAAFFDSPGWGAQKMKLASFSSSARVTFITWMTVPSVLVSPAKVIST